jgi:hypothetical protein
MKLVTTATHSDGYMPYLKKSCERFGDELIVLGWGQKWTGYSFKIQLMNTFLKDLSDDEVVCFIDSFDVIMLRSLKELEESFRVFSKHTGVRLVVGFDRAQSTIIHIGAAIQFGTIHGYHVNSGTYMGYVKELKHMINNVYKDDPKLDDQKLLTDYCRSFPNRVYIDNASIFFLTINNPLNNFYIPQLMEVDKNKNLWFRGVKPFFAHGNGNTSMDELIERLGYPMSAQDKQRIASLNKKTVVKKAKWYIQEFITTYCTELLLFFVIILVIVIKRKLK